MAEEVRGIAAFLALPDGQRHDLCNSVAPGDGSARSREDAEMIAAVLDQLSHLREPLLRFRALICAMSSPARYWFMREIRRCSLEPTAGDLCDTAATLLEALSSSAAPITSGLEK